MTIEQGSITFVNIENFEKFLKENLKEEFANDLIFDLQEYIDDLVSQHAASGANDYELDSSYTKSGHPKCISFEYHFEEDPDYPDCFNQTFEFWINNFYIKCKNGDKSDRYLVDPFDL